MVHDRFTRILHLLLAPGMLIQLLVSFLMDNLGSLQLRSWCNQVHEYLGLVLLGVLVLYWGWAMLRRGQIPFTQLFPWFTPGRYPPLLADARFIASHMLRLHLPPEDQPSPLAYAVQGLGLLVGTVLGISGLILFLYALYPTDYAQVPGWLHGVQKSHETLGPFMWGYLGVHAGMVSLYQLAGQGALRAMFLEWGPSTPPR